MTDCYFCQTNVSGFSVKSIKSFEYPSLHSAIRPVPHDDSLPVWKPPETWSMDEGDKDATMHESDVKNNTSPDAELLMSDLYLIIQPELKDMLRNFLSADLGAISDKYGRRFH